MLWYLGQKIFEITIRVQIVCLGRFCNAVTYSTCFGARNGVYQMPVAFPDHEASYGLFSAVVVQRDFISGSYLLLTTSPKEKPATEVTDFSVNLVLNQFTSPPQQYSCSKDQDAAEDREEPCAGAAGGWKFVAFNRCVDDLLPICCFWHITTCKYEAITF